MIDLNERMQQIRDLLITPVTDDEARSIVALLDKIESATPAPQAAPSELWPLIDAYADMRAEYQNSTARHLAKTQRENVEHAKEELLAFLAAAPAVAITQAATSALPQWIEDRKGRDPETDALIEYIIKQQAATSEPVAMPQVELDASLDTWMDVEPKDVPTWQRKGFNVRTLYAAPVAHLAGTTPNTEAPSDERAAFEAHFLAMWAKRYPTISHDGVQKRISRHEDGRYVTDEAEHQWNGWQARAALSAQQAGVQEAPSEDAKDERVHELDAAMSLLRVALTVDAGKVSPAALRKQVMESVAIAAGADGEGEEYIYADVYGHLCELIEPYVLGDERPEGYPFTASVTDTMSMLIEHYQRTAALAAATQTEKK